MRWRRLRNRWHESRRRKPSVFLHLALAFLAAAVAVALTFGIAARQIGRPSPPIRAAIEANARIFVDALIGQLGHPVSQAAVEQVARERKVEVRVDLNDGTLYESEPGLPDPVGLRTWHPAGLAFIEFSHDQGRVSVIIRQAGATYSFSISRNPVPFLRWQWWAGFVVIALVALLLAFVRALHLFSPVVRRLRDSLESKEQLLRDVSHELRSPLARVKVAMALLPDSKVRTSVEEDIRELDRLIETLLETGRLKDSERSFRLQPIDLREVIDPLAESVARIPPGLLWKRPPTEIWVDGDAERLRLLFRNLFENATKYANDAARPSELSVSRSPADHEVHLILTDFGRGIGAHDRERLFEPFFRSDRARTKKLNEPAGFGLGLDLARRIAELHGGTLDLLPPRSGVGAEFRVTFPLRRVSTEI